MQQDWQQQVAQQKHCSVDYSAIKSSSPAIDTLFNQHESLYCPLAQLGGITVSGDDATTFLQGQFSNDITQVSDERAQLSAYCTPKGRVLATMLVLRWQQKYWLIMPKNLLQGIKNRLQMFVLRSKVNIDQAPDEFVLIGVMQQQSAAAESIFGPLASSPYHCISSPHAISVNLPGLVRRSLILCELPAAIAALDKQAVFTDATLWSWLNMTAGIPAIESATQESFTPQMINLDLIDAVNFRKGCYPGQEVVARTHYLGKVKRRTHCFNYTGNLELEPNMEIVDADDNNVGTVVSCVRLDSEAGTLLALVPIEKATLPLYLAGDKAIPLTPIELPYSFAANENPSQS